MLSRHLLWPQAQMQLLQMCRAILCLSIPRLQAEQVQRQQRSQLVHNLISPLAASYHQPVLAEQSAALLPGPASCQRRQRQESPGQQPSAVVVSLRPGRASVLAQLQPRARCVACSPAMQTSSRGEDRSATHHTPARSKPKGKNAKPAPAAAPPAKKSWTDWLD